MADGVVGRDLVERVGDPTDRRRITHVLTGKGLAVLQRADGAIESGIKAVIDHLDTPGGRDMAAGFSALNELTRRIAAWEPEDEA